MPAGERADCPAAPLGAAGGCAQVTNLDGPAPRCCKAGLSDPLPGPHHENARDTRWGEGRNFIARSSCTSTGPTGGAAFGTASSDISAKLRQCPGRAAAFALLGDRARPAKLHTSAHDLHMPEYEERGPPGNRARLNKESAVILVLSSRQPSLLLHIG